MVKCTCFSIKSVQVFATEQKESFCVDQFLVMDFFIADDNDYEEITFVTLTVGPA